MNRSLVHAAARELRCERPAKAPVDIEALAKEAGIDLVARIPELGDGRLELRPCEAVIVVSVRQHRVRQRFTIAHDLAHYWLEVSGAGSRRQFTRY